MNGLGMFSLFGLINPFKLLSGAVESIAGNESKSDQAGCENEKCNGSDSEKSPLGGMLKFLLPGI
jgi:hypothetical protein